MFAEEDKEEKEEREEEDKLVGVGVINAFESGILLRRFLDADTDRSLLLIIVTVEIVVVATVEEEEEEKDGSLVLLLTALRGAGDLDFFLPSLLVTPGVEEEGIIPASVYNWGTMEEPFRPVFFVSVTRSCRSFTV